MPKIRVLIVDDSVVIRKLVSESLNSDPEIEVVGLAADGSIGLAKIQQVNPDVVTLDIEMPVMDGLETVSAIRKVHPRLPIIMFSTLTERGASATMDALSLGANDYVTKPANVGSVGIAVARIRSDLIPKIKALCHRAAAKAPPPAKPPIPPRPHSIFTSRDCPEVLTIGVSTGGPNALSELIPLLTKGFPVPIVIVQHMPPLFTRLLAERLAAVAGIVAREGTQGALLAPGELWVAPGGSHMEVERSSGVAKLVLTDAPPENSCRPAVDVLFRSVAKAYGSRTLAIVLTGMGQDGLRGCENIREAGGSVLVQDEASSVVWGMPGAVCNAGLADKVLSIPDLAFEINRIFQTTSISPARRTA